VATAKEQLRRTLRQVRDSISPAIAANAARAAASHLLALPPVSTARTVALYAAARGELDTAPLGRELVARGVRLVYPRVQDARQPLAFHEVALADGAPIDVRPSAFGILEPLASAPTVPLDAIDLFVVPGLAFDRTGTRLGWGLGFYDCTLARQPSAFRIGYCYACQVVPEVPREQRDVPMHCLVTEAWVSRPGDGRERSS
jgi:5-formyltetrahydrofolate cyclo-ligase